MCKNSLFFATAETVLTLNILLWPIYTSVMNMTSWKCFLEKIQWGSEYDGTTKTFDNMINHHGHIPEIDILTWKNPWLQFLQYIASARQKLEHGRQTYVDLPYHFSGTISSFPQLKLPFSHRQENNFAISKTLLLYLLYRKIFLPNTRSRAKPSLDSGH